MNFKNPNFSEEEKTIFNRFPKLFRQTELTMQESCMYWGLDWPEELYYIIENLAEEIDKIAPDAFEFAQIKTKFNIGVIYYDIVDSLPAETLALIQKLVEEAEEKCTEFLKTT